MAKKTYVVRVTMIKNDTREAQIFIEQLRYAGIVKVHETHYSTPGHLGLRQHPFCFDIFPPAGIESKLWAEQNAERMRSYSYAAEVAEKGSNVTRSQEA